jgi:large subunit ribosomal protein L20
MSPSSWGIRGAQARFFAKRKIMSEPPEPLPLTCVDYTTGIIGLAAGKRRKDQNQGQNLKSKGKIGSYEEESHMRIKGGLNAKKKHKKVLKMAKGFYGARSKQYRVAKQSVMRALAHAFAGRKQTKRDFRRLWITRINAAARINGTTYSRLISGLKNAGIVINRKMLADLAVNDAEAFANLARRVS